MNPDKQTNSDSFERHTKTEILTESKRHINKILISIYVFVKIQCSKRHLESPELIKISVPENMEITTHAKSKEVPMKQPKG